MTAVSIEPRQRKKRREYRQSQEFDVESRARARELNQIPDSTSFTSGFMDVEDSASSDGRDGHEAR